MRAQTDDCMIKLALDTIDLELLRWVLLDEAMSKNPVDRHTTSSPAICWSEQRDRDAAMNRSRITDDMFARVPALLLEGMTKAEIAAMYWRHPRHLGGAVQSARHIAAQRRGTA